MNSLVYVSFIFLNILLTSSKISIAVEKKNVFGVFPAKYILWNTSDCGKDLDVYKPNTNREWPTKVISPSYEIFTENLHMRLEISWKADTKNVKGFKIVLKPTGKPDICRILDYKDTIKNHSSGLYWFRFNINNIDQQVNFTAELSPLPSHGNSTVHVSKFNTLDCSIFRIPFTFNYDGKYLNVIFSKGPNACNFQKYKIEVHKTENMVTVTTEIVPTQDNVEKLQANFELNICRGYYFILMSVFQESPNSCECRNRKNYCRRSCIYNSSHSKYLIPARSCSQKAVALASKEPEENKKYFFIFDIAIGLLLLNIIVLAVVYWKLSVNLMAKKRGIVLFLDDHKHHTDAVFKLVEYLNKCHLKVSIASAILKNHDIPNQLVVISEALKCDFILLVLSKALQKRMEAWNKQQDYMEFFKHKNSNILTKPLLEILLESKKLYVCKFDHVNKFGHWPKHCYSLPTDLTQMTADLNGQSFRHKILRCNHMRSSALLKNLQESIENAFLFEQSKKEWFQETYVCPTNIADSSFMGYEPSTVESIGHSDYVHPEKLKDIFTIYRETFNGFPEHSINMPSI